ncbi:hypothetical protein Nekkels1_14 [Cellulophaga phage Nekkels_1]|uniref:Uncharacterized protein n=1 Tax=Cellulophaga phage Nekkels_1 TaxID=2745692 RepID=A0A8E4UXE7_9CAUD|nr:hypothetical protein M1M31_gp14 [Cellulophaga phage Nekkels_1]QQO97013.1 hypothetical protein Nekkels1_14 [Cellulophaga phage Nekkels_1]QQO97106.1 hypothetical protein Nekkels2_14 [Cellulophaga phage Nekkels_2]
MAYMVKIDSEGHEIRVNIKPVYKIPKKDILKDLELRRSYLLIELDSIEEQINKLKK